VLVNVANILASDLLPKSWLTVAISWAITTSLLGYVAWAARFREMRSSLGSIGYALLFYLLDWVAAAASASLVLWHLSPTEARLYLAIAGMGVAWIMFSPVALLVAGAGLALAKYQRKSLSAIEKVD
jgi:hypothetical protein